MFSCSGFHRTIVIPDLTMSNEHATGRDAKLTVAWEVVRPLVQGRIKFGDDALFPLLVRVA